MIYSIKNKDSEKIRHLFRSLETFQPMCTAVLDGIWPGMIWVDNPDVARSALLITFLSGGGAAWCFLAGEPGNCEFNIALNKAIFEDKITGQEVETFLFTCHPEDWGGQLVVVGSPRQPAPMARRHYICRELTYDWRGNIPDGYAAYPLESSLLQQKGLQIPNQLKETLGKWESIQNEQLQDYGFIIIHDDQVVSWATVDFISSGSGDLGFETDIEHRRCGLGTVVAAAALEYGLAHGLSTIHWTCAADNIGSLRTAEKLGLEHDSDYTIFLFALDEGNHLAQLAYSHLTRGEYQTAVDRYEELFAQQKG
ncbi:GNAT family N-acetyltransferase [Candidatus Leptofilum sp.]|uniref:GNAT family N-acetyltransferase n=1 Tax=Candidatus Leptofilum sp. TaxID=3241576 RepID=UPI003B5ADB59